MTKARQIETKDKLGEGKLIKVSRFKGVIKRTRPHRHDGYYELIYLLKGEGFHLVETDNFPVAPPEVYFLKPGQIHCWQFSAIPQGYVVLFKKEFFDPVNDGYFYDLIKSLKTITRVAFPENHQPVFLFEEMLREYENPSKYAHHVIHGSLRSVFSRVVQLSSTNESRKGKADGLHENFSELVTVNCQTLHKVSDYARMLHTSPQNLNAACRKYTGKSASAHIAAQLMLEAKRYILHTDMNINEIADVLHFNDASYFVKFFKKNEGITPLQFRGKYFQ